MLSKMTDRDLLIRLAEPLFNYLTPDQLRSLSSEEIYARLRNYIAERNERLVRLEKALNQMEDSLKEGGGEAEGGETPNLREKFFPI